MSKSDKAALDRQRAANRVAAIGEVVELAEFVMGARHQGTLSKTRIFGVPIVAGGRLWLAVKLALDHPDVFSACLRGEYESVSAAGRAAGLARAMPRRRLELGKDLKRSARSLFDALDQTELLEFCKELAQLDSEREERRKPKRRQPRPIIKSKHWPGNPAKSSRPTPTSRII